MDDELIREIKAWVEARLDREITLAALSDAVCYSPEYLSRVFKKRAGVNLFDYVRERRLLHAAEEIKSKGNRVIDIALSHGFESHEGFTRAFTSYYGIPPRQFRKYKPEIKEFMPRGLKAFPIEGREVFMNDTLAIFTQIIERPERKLFLLRAEQATEYFAYCQEVGCDIWGRLLEVENPLYEPLGLWMPEPFRPAGTSEYVQGVEVSMDWEGSAPEGLECQILPPCKYLVFQSEPYENDDDTMMKVIGKVWEAIGRYKPENYGFRWAPEDGPRFQAAPLAERGYIEGRPVRTV